MLRTLERSMNMIGKATSLALTLTIFTAAYRTTGSLAAPAGDSLRAPKLLFSWWRKKQRPACAVGFASRSSAIILAHNGLEFAGVLKGPRLSQFDKTAQTASGIIGLYLGHTPRRGHLTLDMLQASNATMMPTHLALPPGWATGTLPLAVSPDGRILAAAVHSVHSSRGAPGIWLWGSRNRRSLGICLQPHAVPISLAFSPGGGSIAIGYVSAKGTGFIRIWNVHGPTPKKKILGPPGHIHWRPLAMTYVGRRRLDVADKHLYIFDLTRQIQPQARSAPSGASFIPQADSWFGMLEGTLLYVPSKGQLACVLGGGGRPTIGICDAKSGRLVHRLALTHQASLTFITALQSVPKSGYALVAITSLTTGLTGFFGEIELTTGRFLWRSPDISGGCFSIAVSPGGRAALTGGELGSRLWRLPLGR